MSFLLGLPIFRGYVRFQGCREPQQFSLGNQRGPGEHAQILLKGLRLFFLESFGLPIWEIWTSTSQVAGNVFFSISLLQYAIMIVETIQQQWTTTCEGNGSSWWRSMECTELNGIYIHAVNFSKSSVHANMHRVEMQLPSWGLTCPLLGWVGKMMFNSSCGIC